jgi:cystathionine gamma-synthase
LPSCLEYFHHATSLGGVESLVEWRAMSDETVDRALVRFSIGVEDSRDLKEDMRSALKKLSEAF